MIREYREDDLEIVNQLGSNLKKDFDIRKKGKLEQVFVYTVNEKVLGFISFIKLYETVELLYIVVDESMRQSGIGQEFINFLSKLEEVYEIIIEVRESNVGALRFYKKCHFVKTRDIKNYYLNGENGIQMKRVVK